MSFDEIFDLTAGVYFHLKKKKSKVREGEKTFPYTSMSFDKIFDLKGGVYFIILNRID